MRGMKWGATLAATLAFIGMAQVYTGRVEMGFATLGVAIVSALLEIADN